ncbi:hypothetical protein SDC9_186626 [bioreactor metagenome]|uniref:Uncharacterized protein n=1 Tax=bioreactor metagenome TaxID=1076179 RepID=A0A645HK23_9ZZZZ
MNARCQLFARAKYLLPRRVRTRGKTHRAAHHDIRLAAKHFHQPRRKAGHGKRADETVVFRGGDDLVQLAKRHICAHPTDIDHARDVFEQFTIHMHRPFLFDEYIVTSLSLGVNPQFALCRYFLWAPSIGLRQKRKGRLKEYDLSHAL